MEFRRVLFRSCQAKIASKMAFVKLVEDQRGHAIEHRIVLDHAGEDAFCHHLDAGRGTHLVFEADAVAHRVADSFAACAGHEARRGACRHPPRFEHDDAAVAAPRRMQQCRWYLGGLAGTWRRLQYQPPMRLQNKEEGRGGEEAVSMDSSRVVPYK